MMPIGKTKPRVNNRELLAALLEALLSGTRTAPELADYAGLHYMTVLGFTKILHERGVIHVSGWRKDKNGRERAAMWQLGPGIDAPRRKPKTSAQRQAKYKAGKLAAEEGPLQTTGALGAASRHLESVWTA